MKHKRHMKKRDYGRLFHNTKFNYDPFQDEEETMGYFEEQERIGEIERYKE